MSGAIDVRFAVRDQASPRIRDLAERLRARGFNTTSSTTKETAMPAKTSGNPYERRRDRARDRHRLADGMEAMPLQAGYSGYVESPRGLAIEDLEALAFSARTRGEQAATERVARFQHDEIQTARRQAWDEGHEEGRKDGGQALLDEIDEQFGAKVRERSTAALDLLKRVGVEPRKVTKSELEVELDKCRDVLAELVEAHHSGFARTLPF